MTFDRATRTTFARTIARARERLKTDVMDQLRRLGFQEDGTQLPLDQIAGLREEERQAGEDLRALLAHHTVSERGGSESARRRAAYDRLAREIGFTTLHRLVAIRMAEERWIVVPATAQGFSSEGFQVYERVANDALGGRAETYRAFIERLYDELALDLPALFDRADPTAWVFPSEGCLTDLFALLNAPEIAPLWREDEAIGWVYQYYNDPDERKKMREGGAPQNTRELAVRNQFFTPRYVVEFLTDNTLGRLWYEMRRGETRLVDQCRYLIRRKHPIWLPKGESPRSPYDRERDGSDWGRTDHVAVWLRPSPDSETGVYYAHTIDGYQVANNLFPELAHDDEPLAAAVEMHRRIFDRYRETGSFSGSFEELRIAQFAAYRADRFGMEVEEEPFFAELHQALCAQWDLEADVIPYRPMQDPRELKVLDPACGSGHFLLYAYDLLTTIYGEAYDDPEVGGSLRSLYPDRALFERDLPRLILEHNLHGVDIDPRAAQIAQLALWLRAQRAWTEAGLAAANRPRVRRIRIVTAEPMPAEPDLIAAAKDRLDPRIRPLVDQIWEKMRLAGEAGTLLRIEDEIREALAAAARRAGADLSVPVRRSLPGFAVAPEQASFDFSPSSRSDAAFWANGAEPTLLAALEQIAEEAEGRAAVRRRLFVRDAATGFAFIDLCRLQFDVVLMNPPFGDGTEGLRALLAASYPDSKLDLATAMIERAIGLCREQGLIGAITTRTVFFQMSNDKWRKSTLDAGRKIKEVLDMGYGVLDGAVVETAAYIVSPTSLPRSLWLRLIDDEDKQQVTAEALAALKLGRPDRNVLVIDSTVFANLPGTPFAYWTPNRVFELFEIAPRFEECGHTVRAGMDTLDDFRFLRTWWEVSSSGLASGWGARDVSPKWVTYAKAGTASPFWSPIPLVLSWLNSGREVKQYVEMKAGSASRNIRSESLYFKPGLTFGRRVRRLSPSILPASSIFSNSANVIFHDTEQPEVLLPDLALLNSTQVRWMLSLFAPVRKMEAGYIARLPWPPNDEAAIGLTRLALEGIYFQRDQLSSWEEERIFSGSLQKFESSRPSSPNGSVMDLRSVIDRIDKVSADVFGISSSLPQRPLSSDELRDTDEGGAEEDMDMPIGRVGIDLLTIVGFSFGRWDIRIAKDPTLTPELQQPFDPLPICSPATLVGPDGLPAQSGGIATEAWLRARPNAITLPPEHLLEGPATIADSAYPLPIPWNGLLIDDVDEPDRPDGLLTRVQAALSFLYSHEAPEVERKLAVDAGGRSLTEYLRRPSGFFADHLTRYSRSGRKAPIYWPLSTPSGSFTVWVYYPRLTSDTLYRIDNQYLQPKLATLDREIGEATRELPALSGKAATQQRERLEERTARREELLAFREELLRVAGLPYRPDHNDGVILCAAPLWRLFRLSKWAKATREAWEKLERGEYDWAHLAMAIWPERVLEKCRTDRSLAIAHDREELYVAPPQNTGKKGKRAAALPLVDDEEDES